MARLSWNFSNFASKNKYTGDNDYLKGKRQVSFPPVKIDNI